MRETTTSAIEPPRGAFHAHNQKMKSAPIATIIASERVPYTDTTASSAARWHRSAMANTRQNGPRVGRAVTDTFSHSDLGHTAARSRPDPLSSASTDRQLWRWTRRWGGEESNLQGAFARPGYNRVGTPPAQPPRERSTRRRASRSAVGRISACDEHVGHGTDSRADG